MILGQKSKAPSPIILSNSRGNILTNVSKLFFYKADIPTLAEICEAINVGEMTNEAEQISKI